MEQQKWTLKQVLFEKELNYDSEALYINGFRLPRDKEFLRKELEELFERYPSKYMGSVMDKITNLNTNSELSIRVLNGGIKLKYGVFVNDRSPLGKKLMFTDTCTIEYCFIERGLHIHKDCLEIGD